MISENRPLSGLTVLDMGIITAGAASSQVFADFGAQVIKVESLTYPDPFRRWTQVAGSEEAAQDLNASPPFSAVNRGKEGIALDLKTKEGRQIFLDLVRDADIVVENFRRGVMERLGVGFETLREVNPRIIVLSLSSQGNSGPEAGYISFGSPLEALGGTMAITGYAPDGPPAWTGNNVNYPDQLVSFLAPGLALAALRARDATGQAIHVDAAQREAVTSVVGETVLEYSATGTVPGPLGNRHQRFAPQGIYPALGEDAWVAISVQNDEQWRTLLNLPGLETLAANPALAQEPGRRAAHDYIDQALNKAIRLRDRDEVAGQLCEWGIPAASVLSPTEVLDHPQLEALGFHTRIDDDELVHRGYIARLSPVGGNIRSRAPHLGEHTSTILRDRLGYDTDRIEELHSSQAIFCAELAALPVDSLS